MPCMRRISIRAPAGWRSYWARPAISAIHWRTRPGTTPCATWAGKRERASTSVSAPTWTHISAMTANLWVKSRVDVGDAALLAEGRIGEHYAEALAGVGRQAVGHADGAGLAAGADPMQVQVHHAQAGGVVHELPAMQGVVIDVVLLVAVERAVAAQDVIVGGQKEAAGAAGRVADGIVGGGVHHLDDGLDQRARGEVLPGAGLGVLGVLLKQALVDGAFHVEVETDPGLAVDQLDQAAQLGRVLDAVLGLAEDDGDQAGADAQFLEDLAVVAFQGVAVEGQQAAPVVLVGDVAGAAQEGGLLVLHLEEEQVGELLQVVAVGHPIVAQDVAVVPDALDDGCGLSGHDYLLVAKGSCAVSSPRRPRSARPNHRGSPESQWQGKSRLQATASARIHFLLVQTRARVRQTGQHVFTGYTGVIGQDIVEAPSLCQQIDNELHGQARAANNRLTDQHLWVGYDTILPLHTKTP